MDATVSTKRTPQPNVCSNRFTREVRERFATYFGSMSTSATTSSGSKANTTKASRPLRRAILVGFAILAVVTPSILTSKGGFGFSPILTGSMRPVAQPGDVFVTRLVPAPATAKAKKATTIHCSKAGVGTRIVHAIDPVCPTGYHLGDN